MHNELQSGSFSNAIILSEKVKEMKRVKEEVNFQGSQQIFHLLNPDELRNEFIDLHQQGRKFAIEATKERLVETYQNIDNIEPN